RSAGQLTKKDRGCLPRSCRRVPRGFWTSVLIPTLCVGTHAFDAPRRGRHASPERAALARAPPATQSVADGRSHAERGNEEPSHSSKIESHTPCRLPSRPCSAFAISEIPRYNPGESPSRAEVASLAASRRGRNVMPDKTAGSHDGVDHRHDRLLEVSS